MIELIRQGQIAEALIFAQTELAPRGEENRGVFLSELENCMALLAFELPKLGNNATAQTATSSKGKGKESNPSASNLPASLAALLQPAHRQRTATEVNAAILKSQCHGSEPKLPNLLRMLAYGEDLLATKVTSFPRLDMTDLLNKAKGGSVVEKEQQKESDRTVQATDMEL